MKIRLKKTTKNKLNQTNQQKTIITLPLFETIFGLSISLNVGLSYRLSGFETFRSIGLCALGGVWPLKGLAPRLTKPLKDLLDLPIIISMDPFCNDFSIDDLNTDIASELLRPMSDVSLIQSSWSLTFSLPSFKIKIECKKLVTKDWLGRILKSLLQISPFDKCNNQFNSWTWNNSRSFFLPVTKLAFVIEFKISVETDLLIP